MQFLQPTALFFLAALAIPVIIHLFYFRRYRKVYFSDIRFLQEAKEVRKNRSRIKKWLVLACRMLAFAFIIFAFAQPFLSEKQIEKKEASHISFFIDNSFSMQADGYRTSLLEEAKLTVRDAIEAYPDYFSFHVIDHELAGEDQQWVNKEEAINKVRRTEHSGKVRQITEIIGRMRQMTERIRENEKRHERFLITDGQRNLFESIPDFEETEQLQIIRLKPTQMSNISIDSAWIHDPVILPGQTSSLYVELSNHSPASVREVPLTFQIDGQTRPAGQFDLEAGESRLDTLPLVFATPGWKELDLWVDDHSVRFDDKLHLSVSVTGEVKTLLIAQNERINKFRAAISSDEKFRFDQVGPQQVIYSALKNYDLIILDGVHQISTGLASELQRYCKEGSNILFFPHHSGDLSSYNSFLSLMEAGRFLAIEDQTSEVIYVNSSSDIFTDVFRNADMTRIKSPQVQRYYRHEASRSGKFESLLSLRNGHLYVSAIQTGLGNFYVCSSATDEASSDLTANGSFFVPMLHRMATTSRRGLLPYYTLGQNERISIKNPPSSKDPVYHLTGPSDIIPAWSQEGLMLHLSTGDQLSRPGHYILSSADSILATIAFNFDRSESDMTVLSDQEIAEINPEHFSLILPEENVNLASTIVSRSQNSNFWRWCIFLALLLLLLEQILLRHVK